MKKALAAAAAGAISFLVCAPASAVIVVQSKTTVGDGIRAQMTISETTSRLLPGQAPPTQTAVGIRKINATIILRDDVTPPGPIEGAGNLLSVTKRQLTAAQAYGLGLPGGYEQPPFTDPQGPWQGLTWPYRDQYDYFATPTDPLADNVGTPFFDSPDIYGFANIQGIARGGPTDPVGAPGSADPSRLLRGIDGNGLPTSGPSTYFYFDISNLSGDADRFVRLQIVGASAVVVQRDNAGNYSEILVPVPDYSITIQLPEPASIGIIGLAAASLLRRRR